MLNRFLKQEPVLDEESTVWLFDTFAWALQQFDAQVFTEQTALVLPTNDFFPGREESVEGMARLIFKQVQDYVGLAHWPFELVHEQVFQPIDYVLLSGFPRDRAVGHALPVVSNELVLPVPYSPELVRNPEALIVSYVQTLAHYLGSIASEAPPGGAENWPQTREVLTVFLGFGVLSANSAYLAPGGCGSCRVGMPTRPSFLSQHDLTYALGIFSVLKGINAGDVTRHLKSSLKSYYKRAVKDVEARSSLLDSVRQQMNGNVLQAGSRLVSPEA